MSKGIARMFRAGASVSAPAVSPEAAAAGAQALAMQLGDESLSEMLMAWYYAGYCTGMIASKRQTNQEHC